MIYIKHRVNTSSELVSVPREYGVEVDLRDSGKRLILAHDAFTDGEDFEKYLRHFRHSFLIANIKCEGIEQRVLEILNKNGITDFFMLDASFPAMAKLFRSGERRLAIRVSEYEKIDPSLALSGMVQWAWVDCFHGQPLEKKQYDKLKKYFKLCLVSPELQGYPLESINDFATAIKKSFFDAVCTKQPDIWLEKTKGKGDPA